MNLSADHDWQELSNLVRGLWLTRLLAAVLAARFSTVTRKQEG